MVDHYYSEIQSGEMKRDRISARIRGNNIELNTSSGVFSPKKIDKGSILLAEKSEINEGWDVLDLGCGYGAVGIAVAKAFPDSNVVMSDINRRAVMLANENIKLNRLSNAKAVHSDLFSSIRQSFDTILLNPPQSAGKELCFSMIKLSISRLKESGSLQVVARHNKGGKALSEKMMAVFGNVEGTAKSAGYRIYLSRL